MIERTSGSIYDFPILKQSTMQKMRTSEIIMPSATTEQSPQRASRLLKAYKHERTRQEVTEVELNRSKIVMIDENGNMKRVPILAEH